jgi:hypothetical protein
MSVTTSGFREWTDRAVELAEDCCGGRVVAFLRAATRCATCRPPTWRSSRGWPGLPTSFPEDPVGCDIPRGLRDVEIAAVEAAA